MKTATQQTKSSVVHNGSAIKIMWNLCSRGYNKIATIINVQKPRTHSDSMVGVDLKGAISWCERVLSVNGCMCAV